MAEWLVVIILLGNTVVPVWHNDILVKPLESLVPRSITVADKVKDVIVRARSGDVEEPPRLGDGGLARGVLVGCS